MPAEVLHRAMGRWPGVAFNTVFGMTELSGNVMYFSRAAHEYALKENTGLLRSVGQQLPLARVRVVDDDMNDVPVGEPGELVVKGEAGDAWVLAERRRHPRGVPRRVVPQRRHSEGAITVLTPDGTVADTVRVPECDAFVTNICFGGQDLRTAYITSSGRGKLYATEWPRPGLRLNYPALS